MSAGRMISQLSPYSDMSWSTIDRVLKSPSTLMRLFDGLGISRCSNVVGSQTVDGPLGIAQGSMLCGSSQRASPSFGVESQKLESVREDGQQTDLAGLGIFSCPPAVPLSSVPNFSRPSNIHHAKNRSSLCYGANEILTRSSSHESIILSITSSTIRTQRSSNSSMCADDLWNLSSAPEKQFIDPAATDQVEQIADQTNAPEARPEPGCLPSEVIEQLLSKVSITPSALEAAETEDIVLPIPPVSQHKYSKSSSKVAVPERRLPVIARSRKRFKTTGTRLQQSDRV